jgi:hypothetical protein
MTMTTRAASIGPRLPVKGLRHLNIHDCAVRDSIQAEEVTIHHIQGVINPADIFTKEMKDGLHFRALLLLIPL